MTSNQRFTLLSVWDMAAAVGFIGLGLYYNRVVQLLPDPVPTHFDALGHVNGWTSKANLPWVVFGLTLVPWLVLLLISAGVALANRAQASQAASVAPLRGLMGLGMAFLMGSCLAIPLKGMVSLGYGVVFFFSCMALGVILLVRRSVLTLRSRPQEGHYRWGLFYVNPEDPRLWVEKRVGVGWTLNFGRPAAAWITLLMLSPVLFALGALLMGQHPR